MKGTINMYEQHKGKELAKRLMAEIAHEEKTKESEKEFSKQLNYAKGE